MDLDQGLVKEAEHLRQRQIAANKIRRIAWQYGVCLTLDFEAHKIVDLPKELILKVVGHLMTKNCSSLDRTVDDMNIVMMPAFQLWLANMPKVIDLTAFMSFSPRSHKYNFFKEALAAISRNVPQVEELLWEVHEPTRYVDCILVDSEILDALGQLSQLKTLSIREKFKFRLRDLINLGNQLPNLQSLSIILEEDMNLRTFNHQDPIVAQLNMSLRKLKVLIYDRETRENRPIELELYFFFMLHLCNVHIIDYCDENNIVYRNHFEAMTEDITRQNYVHTQNLRNFKVAVHNKSTFFFRPGSQILRRFPHVLHLEVKIISREDSEPERQMDIKNYEKYLMLFDNIISLNLGWIPPSVVLLFLGKYGHGLKTLYIMNFRSSGTPLLNLSPHEILTLCPSLEKLVLKGERFCEPMEEPIALYTTLKELELVMIPMDEFPLESILHAPNLEKLTLGAVVLDGTLIRNVTTLLTEKKILQRLKSLRIVTKLRLFVSVNFDIVREMSRLIKCAVASLPTLTMVKYDLDVSNFGYSLLAKSLRDRRLTNEEIPGIALFFEGVQLQNIQEDIEQFVDEELISILDKYD